MKNTLCFILILFLFTGCQKTDGKPIEDTAFLLNTVATISIYDCTDKKNAKQLIKDCFALCSSYENKLSRTISGSEIDKINHSNREPVTVSQETASLIQTAFFYGELSEGYFDITIAPISSLWDFQTENPAPPSPEAIKEKLPLVDYRSVQVNETAITLQTENAGLDLGGIAKGYIADKAAAFLKENGVTSGIINLGGNVLTIGGKPDGNPFRIGIQTPFETHSQILGSIGVTEKSVVTSGIYERFFRYEDILYHHILDPYTGYPVSNNLLSVTIVTNTSTEGDALSTSCFLLGKDKGMSLIESLPDTEAIFVTQDAIYFSSGFENGIIPFFPAS